LHAEKQRTFHPKFQARAIRTKFSFVRGNKNALTQLSIPCYVTNSDYLKAIGAL
jgi:hypothetical protein